MGVVSWSTGVDGSWNDGSKWDAGSPPGASDDAQILASGTYTVTSTSNVTVNTLSTGQGVTLSIANNIFTIANGTGGIPGVSGGSAGIISVTDGHELDANGVIYNTGTIALSSSARATRAWRGAAT